LFWALQVEYVSQVRHKPHFESVGIVTASSEPHLNGKLKPTSTLRSEMGRNVTEGEPFHGAVACDTLEFKPESGRAIDLRPPFKPQGAISPRLS